MPDFSENRRRIRTPGVNSQLSQSPFISDTQVRMLNAQRGQSIMADKIARAGIPSSYTPRKSTSSRDTNNDGVISAGERVTHVERPDGTLVPVAAATGDNHLVKPKGAKYYVSPSTGKQYMPDPTSRVGLQEVSIARKEDLAADKERQKQEALAAKEAVRAENDRREAVYTHDKRPTYTDAHGRIQPVHTDEEWTGMQKQKHEAGVKANQYLADGRKFYTDKLTGQPVPYASDEEHARNKAEKQAKLDAAAAEKPHKDKLEVLKAQTSNPDLHVSDKDAKDAEDALSGAESGLMAQRGNDDLATPLTDDEVQKALADPAKKDAAAAYINARETVSKITQAKAAKKAIEQEIYKTNLRIADPKKYADELKVETPLKSDDELAAHASEITNQIKARDADVKQEAARITQKDDQFSQQYALTKQKYDEALTGGDPNVIGTLGDSMRDLEQQMLQWQGSSQDQRAAVDAEAEQIKHDASHLQILADEQKKRDAVRQEQYTAALDAALPGAGQKYKAVTKDAYKRREDLQAKYPDPFAPEAKAAFEALHKDFAEKAGAITKEAEAEATKQAEAGKALYDEFGKDYQADWSDPKASDNVTSMMLVAAEKHGLTEKQARHWLSTYAQADWDRPSAVGKGSSPLKHTAGEDAEQEYRVLPNGNITVNPGNLLDKEEYERVVKSAPVSREAKEQALKVRQQIAPELAEKSIATLRSNDKMGEWLDENTSGTDLERMEQFTAKMKAGGWTTAAMYRFASSLANMGASWTGAAAAATGSDTFTQASVPSLLSSSWWKKRAEQFDTAAGTAEKGTNLLGKYAAMAVGGIPSVAESMVAGNVAGGVLKGAAALKGAYGLAKAGVQLKKGLDYTSIAAKAGGLSDTALQTAGVSGAALDAAIQQGGSTYVDAYDKYLKDEAGKLAFDADGGNIPKAEIEAAKGRARMMALKPAILDAAQTAALTALGGAKGTEAIFRKGGKEALKEGVKKSFGKKLGELGLDIGEEALEEYSNQFVSGVIAQATYEPEKTIKQIFEQAFDAGIVGGVLGGLGGGVKQFGEYREGKNKASDQPPAPDLGPAPTSSILPEQTAAIGAAIDNWTPTGSLPSSIQDAAKAAHGKAPTPEQHADTARTAAHALADIAAGQDPRAMSTEVRRALGIKTNSKTGAIEPLSKSVAPLVESVEDAKGNHHPVITDAAREWLSKEVPTAAEAVKLSYAERVDQIKNPPKPAKKPKAAPKAKAETPAADVSSEPGEFAPTPVKSSGETDNSISEPKGATSPSKPAESVNSGQSHPRLPRELASAKPAYSYGKKQFSLEFESDIDRAAYIAAKEKPSKRDADFVAFVMKHTGMNEAAVRAHGAAVRAYIKPYAAEGKHEGTILIPSQLSPVDVAAHKAATSPKNETPHPTDAQAKAGNYPMGHVSIGGLDITIENPHGSKRKWKNAAGESGENTMNGHYGYIKGTVGNDSDHIDTLVKEGTPPDWNGTAYVIHQNDPTTGKFDEHKVYIGFNSAAEAKDAYHSNYQKGWKGFGSIEEMSMADLAEGVKIGAFKQKPQPAEQEKAPRGTNEPVATAPEDRKDAAQGLAGGALLAAAEKQSQAVVSKMQGEEKQRAIIARDVILAVIRRYNGHLPIDLATGDNGFSFNGTVLINPRKAIMDVVDATSTNAEAKAMAETLFDHEVIHLFAVSQIAAERVKSVWDDLPADVQKATIEAYSIRRVASGQPAVKLDSFTGGHEYFRAMYEATRKGIISEQTISPKLAEKWKQLILDFLAKLKDLKKQFASIKSEAKRAELTARVQAILNEVQAAKDAFERSIAPQESNSPGKEPAQAASTGAVSTTGTSSESPVKGSTETVAASDGAGSITNEKESSRKSAKSKTKEPAISPPEIKEDAPSLKFKPVPGAEVSAIAKDDPVYPFKFEGWASTNEGGRLAVEAGGDTLLQAQDNAMRLLSERWHAREERHAAKAQKAAEPTTAPKSGASKESLDKIKGAFDSLNANPAPESKAQVGLPKERRAAFLDVAESLIADGVNTPEGLAAALTEARPDGSLQKYSQALWNFFGTIDPDLTGQHDWHAIYAPKVEAKPASAKEQDEAKELEITKQARMIVLNGNDEAQTYKDLVALYESQPALTAKTSTSKINQAYSTPAPMAYVTSRLADVVGGKVIAEPSAGNGMLLIERHAGQTVEANELDPSRRARLAEQGIKSTDQDATVWQPSKTPDRVVANPPFGQVMEAGGSNKVFSTPMGETTSIDHAIVLQSLATMAQDGRAAFIIGGPPPTVRTPEARAKFYRDGKAGKFFAYLYENNNVIDHFTVSGDLYKKQGAGWPLDIFVIRGKTRSVNTLPGLKAPRIISSWEELSHELDRTDADRIKLNQLSAAEMQQRVDAMAGKLDGLSGGLRGDVSTSGTPRVRNGPANSEVATSDRSSPSESAGDSANETATEELPADRGLAGESIAPTAERVEGTEQSGERQLRTEQPVESSDFQAPFPATSGVNPAGLLAPKNLIGPMSEAMARLKKDVGGDLVAFVREKLGYPKTADISKYFFGDQIDALAQAIHTAENGGALVIGDQTGTGKGRIAAGLMKYCVGKGLIPVFVTKDQQLYDAMLDDLQDIDAPEVIPVITNENIKEKSLKDKLADLGSQQGEDAFNSIIEIGDLPGKTNAIFTSYDQIKADDAAGITKAERARAKRDMEPPPDKWRMAALRAVAPRAMFILDESHLAGGQSTTGWRFGALLKNAKHAYYSSATFAKRPDNMGIYFRTNLGTVGGDINGLIELMQAGGVPAMQIGSSMLAQDGQYMRRERSYQGVTFQTHINQSSYERDKVLADNYTEGLRSIIAVQERMSQAANIVNTILSAFGKRASIPVGNRARLESSNFSAKLHNLVRQYLLAIKANTAAQIAVKAIKDGIKASDGTVKRHKVIVAVENTMEAVISDLSAQGLPLNYNGVLQMYLNQMKRIKVSGGAYGREAKYFEIKEEAPEAFKDTKDSELRSMLVVPAMDPVTGESSFKVNEDVSSELIRRAMMGVFSEAREIINDIQLADMPLSPIDAMRQAVEREGIRTGEMTGRTTGIDKNGQIYQRTPAEVKGKLTAKNEFNNSDLDFLVINKTGSTGVSMHASDKFKDQRPRMMMVVQANLDINEFMQTLGRIHRAGQVELPLYMNLQSALPAENRPAAITGQKMSMLNANTTSNADSEVTQKDGVDIFNQYGDEVVHNYLGRNPGLTRMLAQSWQGQSGDSKLTDSNGSLYPLGDFQNAESGGEYGYLSRSVTGHLAILPVEEQEAFWEAVSADYRGLIDYLDQIGQNSLRASVLDLKSETVSSAPFTPGSDTGSVFGRPSALEIVNAKMGKEPMKADDALKIANKAKTTADNRQNSFMEVSNDRIEAEDKRKEVSARNWSERREDWLDGQRQQRDTIANALGQIGMFGYYKRDDSSDGYAFIEDVQTNAEKLNTPSAQFAIVRVNDSQDRLKIPVSQLSQFFRPHMTTDAMRERVASEGWERTWEYGTQQAIVTGNLMAALRKLTENGAHSRVISYTKADGSQQMGIMLSSSVAKQLSENAENNAIVANSADAKMVIDAGYTIKNANGNVRLAGRDGTYHLYVPESRAQGGKYWRDPGLLALTGEFNQTTKGTFGATFNDSETLAKVFNYLTTIQNERFTRPVDSNSALGQPPAGRDDPGSIRNAKRIPYRGLFKDKEASNGRVITENINNRARAGQIIRSFERDWAPFFTYIDDTAPEGKRKDALRKIVQKFGMSDSPESRALWEAYANMPAGELVPEDTERVKEAKELLPFLENLSLGQPPTGYRSPSDMLAATQAQMQGSEVRYVASKGKYNTPPKAPFYTASRSEYAKNFGDHILPVSVRPQNTLDLTAIRADNDNGGLLLKANLQKAGISTDGLTIYSDDELAQALQRNLAVISQRLKDAGYDSAKLNEYVLDGGEDASLLIVSDDIVGDKATTPAGLQSMFNPKPGRPATGERTLFETPKKAAFQSKDLHAAYQRAIRGSSTSSASIRSVFDEAKKSQPSLSADEFKAQVKADYYNGLVGLEPSEQSASVEKAGQFTMRDSLGVVNTNMVFMPTTEAEAMDAAERDVTSTPDQILSDWAGTGEALGQNPTAQDAEYMAAVESGDVAKQQSMVDAAAKAAGYDRKLFHGTNSTETVEGESTSGSAEATESLKALAKRVGLSNWSGVTSVYQRLADNGQMGVTQADAANAKRWQKEASGTYEPSREKLSFDVFSPPAGELELGVHLGNESAASMFGEVFPFFTKLGKPFRLPDLGTWNYQSVIRELRKRGVKISEGEYDEVFNARDNNAALRELLKSKGIPSVVYRNEAEGEGDSFIAFDPNQIKSADPITRDAEGKIIPLSQRFNSESNSILFQNPAAIDPTVANQGDTDENREAFARARGSYITNELTKANFEEIRQKVEEQIDEDEQGMLDNIQYKVANDEELSLEEEIARRMLANTLRTRGVRENDQAMVTLADSLWGQDIRDATETARKLAIRMDQLQTPQERLDAAMGRIIAPNRANLRKRLVNVWTPSAKRREIARLEGEIAKAATAASRASFERTLAEAKSRMDQNDIIDKMAAENNEAVDKILKRVGLTQADLTMTPDDRHSLQTAVLDLPQVKNAMVTLSPEVQKAIEMSVRGYTDAAIARDTGLKTDVVERVTEHFRNVTAKQAISQAVTVGKQTLGGFIEGGKNLIRWILKAPPAPLQNMVNTGVKNAANVQVQVQAILNAAIPTRRNRNRRALHAAVVNGKKGQKITVFVPYDPTDWQQVYRVARELSTRDATTLNKVYEYWINGILSGPQTHVVNTASNTLSTLWHYGPQWFASATVNTVIRDPNSTQWGEFPKVWAGFMKGIQPAMANFALAWRTEADPVEHTYLDRPVTVMFNDASLEKAGGGRGPSIGGIPGRIIRSPGRFLVAMDAFAKTLIMHGEVSAYAYRLGKQRGLAGVALENFMASQIATHGSESWEHSLQTAKELTFQDENDITKAVEKVTNAAKQAKYIGLLFKFLLPFVRTPTNIYRTGMRKAGGSAGLLLYRLGKAGFYKIHKGENFFDTYSKGKMVQDVSESVMAGGLWLLAMALSEGDTDDEKKTFEITGSRPYGVANAGERASQLRQEGGSNLLILRKNPVTGEKLADPIRIPYGRYEPMALTIGTLVDAAREFKEWSRLPGGEQTADKLAGTIMQHIVAQAQDKTFLQGISSVAQLAEDMTQNRLSIGESVSKQFVNGVVPNLIRQPLRQARPQLMDAKKPDAVLGSKILGGALAEGQAKINESGQPVTRRGGPVGNILFPGATEPSKALFDTALKDWNARHPGEKWNPDPITKGDWFIYDPAMGSKKGKFALKDSRQISLFEKNVGIMFNKLAAQALAKTGYRPGVKVTPAQIEAIKDAQTAAIKRVRSMPPSAFTVKAK